MCGGVGAADGKRGRGSVANDYAPGRARGGVVSVPAGRADLGIKVARLPIIGSLVAVVASSAVAICAARTWFVGHALARAIRWVV